MHHYRGLERVQTLFTPVFGSFWKIGKEIQQHKDIWAGAKRSSKEFPNKKVLVTNLFTNVYVFIRDPQYSKELLLKSNNYVKHSMIGFLRPLMGTGLVFGEGEAWKRHRK